MSRPFRESGSAPPLPARIPGAGNREKCACNKANIRFYYYLCKCQRVAAVRRLSRTCDAEMSRLVGPSSGSAPVRPAIDSESSRSTVKRSGGDNLVRRLRFRWKIAKNSPLTRQLEITSHCGLCFSTPTFAFAKLHQLRFLEKTLMASLSLFRAVVAKYAIMEPQTQCLLVHRLSAGAVFYMQNTYSLN